MPITALKTLEQSTRQDQLASYCKAAGDTLRLEVLCVLQHNAYSVLELCQLFNVRQPAMSHHLKVLANSGLVATRREGNTIFYRRVPSIETPLLRDLHNALLVTVDNLVLNSNLKKKVSQLHEARSETSRQFFQQNAQRFDANQDLIASYRDYGTSIIEVLDASVTNRATAIEVGPGQGELLAELSSRFQRVHAVDNAEELLNISRLLAQKQNLTNIDFVLNNITDKTLSLPKADCITLNMVLHHLPQPSQLFPILADLLKPGGVLILTDLCHHEQQWVTHSCGDLWQGFAPEDLNQWATTANLIEDQSLYLAMRNGFRIQIRGFKKPPQELP